MSSIKYTLEFFSHWHCGSGQAAGADIDSLVVKDKDGLPYVPGRTIKGLLREAFSEIYPEDKDTLYRLFGYFDDKEKKEKGCAFFANAELQTEERTAILRESLSEYLYTSLSATAIDENGIAQKHSLRKVEATLPCTLVGEILGVEETDDVSKLQEAMRYVKRLGLGRTRGFGRCEMKMK